MYLSTLSRPPRRSAVLFAVLMLAASATAADRLLLIPGPTIEIKNSKGKFDFLEVDAKNRRLLAAHEKDETADFIDLKADVVLARLNTGPTVGITTNAAGDTYYASVQDDKRIAIIDARTLKETGSIALPGETDAILFDAKDDAIYVTHDNGDEIWVIDAATSKIRATISVPNGPECMAHDTGTDRVYMNSKTTSQVIVISTKTNTVVTQWSTVPATGPHGLALDAAASRLYISGDNGILVALDTKSGKVVGSTEIVAHVDQIAYDPGTKRLFCAGPGQMSIVQVTQDGVKFLGNVATADTAKNVAIDPATHQVWTTYTDGTNAYAKAWSQP